MQKREYTDSEKHRNSLTRVAKALGWKEQDYARKDTWEIEDRILMTIEQRRLELKRKERLIKNLQKEMDMLRQTSIFDFLKIHHEEIQDTHSERTDESERKDHTERHGCNHN